MTFNFLPEGEPFPFLRISSLSSTRVRGCFSFLFSTAAGPGTALETVQVGLRLQSVNGLPISGRPVWLIICVADGST